MEIRTLPLEIICGENIYYAFGDEHTLADIVRWLMENKSEAEEIHYMLGEALDDQYILEGDDGS